jgi:hypothetical protein
MIIIDNVHISFPDPNPALLAVVLNKNEFYSLIFRLFLTVPGPLGTLSSKITCHVNHLHNQTLKYFFYFPDDIKSPAA